MMISRNHAVISGLVWLCCLAGILPGYAETAPSETTTVSIFRENIIHFAPGDSNKYATDLVTSHEAGRVITRTVTLPETSSPVRITAHLVLSPIPKDELEMFDRWDRAGNVRLEIPGRPDLELVKFITAYGGRTEYDVDLSPLASVLHGPCRFKGFVDTWVTPAWKMDFSLTFASDTQVVNPDWVMPVVYNESVTRDGGGDKGMVIPVTIPDGLRRVVLRYYVSGHCTDGTDADEFVRKDNVISVDGIVVHRYRPWRDDCRRFRPINPYCRRWTDGSWSCDYSRSGWCPGDTVAPLELDLTDHLTPGGHTMRFVIENIRPKDDKGNYGYWRVSAQLLGWK